MEYEAKPVSKIKIDTNCDTSNNEVLIERNMHIWDKENLETKFKLLYLHKNSEFFINALQNLYQDIGDMSYQTKNKEFIAWWNLLVERYHLADIENVEKEYSIFFERMKENNYNPKSLTNP